MIRTISSFAHCVLRDIRSSNATLVLDFDDHRNAAIAWLERAHDMSPDDGVSHSYSLKGGWRCSYVETTGYILETFYDLASRGNAAHYAARAERMARWLLSAQLPDGSFPNRDLDRWKGLVFDTGQDLFGLLRAFKETKDTVFIDAALEAGWWLVNSTDSEGLWTRSTYRSVPHVYNTQTAWSLLELDAHEHNDAFEQVARANLDWAVAQQNEQGWFDNCAFETGLAPFTHTIAYAARGLVESSRLLKEHRYKDSAIRVANAAAGKIHGDGFLSGQIAVDGSVSANYCCLTGNCQFSVVWAKLFQELGDYRYRREAIRSLEYVMLHQTMGVVDPNTRGGIAGSYPIWGRYHPFQFPSWAAKFFIDATLLVGGLL